MTDNSGIGRRDTEVTSRWLTRQNSVPALFPPWGAVRSLLVGEAPGPENRGLPFWGDRCGQKVYRALLDLGLADVPEGAWAVWRLEALAKLRPILHEVAITNVVDHLPERSIGGWGAPPSKDIRADNARLLMDINQAWAMCPADSLVVVALGRTAWRTLGSIRAGLGFPIVLREIRHPSRSSRNWTELLKDALTR